MRKEAAEGEQQRRERVRGSEREGTPAGLAAVSWVSDMYPGTSGLWLTESVNLFLVMLFWLGFVLS